MLAIVGATTALAPTAHGFCRTMTGREPGDPSSTNRCDGWNEQSKRACCPYGKPLFWKNACVGYSLQRASSRQLSLNDAEAVFAKAFQTWTKVTCGSGTSNRVSLDMRYLGPVECGEVRYNSEGPNQNVIVFRDSEWPHRDPTNTLALTTVRYDADNGEIFGADMEINAAQPSPLSASDSLPPGALDLLSIATHEAGHFLGFAHSVDTEATMYASYRAISMRDLSPDDTNGICGVYPPDQTRATGDGPVPAEACDPTPRHGFVSTCEDTSSVEGGGGCAVAPPGTSTNPSEEPWRWPSSIPVLLAGTGLVLLRRLRGQLRPR
ncbi:matrixin family metalloprotease [Pendulispora brunnea]|uniref:Matrixin family metalloprotease n=1 Tax=Pendulispora brunnea TaxID=2905690 RepID=A0ABZ2JVA4_9BACT